MTKSKIFRAVMPVVLTLLAGGALYYYAPPAINIHDPSAWWTMIFLLVVYGVLRLIFSFRTLTIDGRPTRRGYLGFAAAGVLVVVFFVINFFSGPLFNASRYAKAGEERITVGNFATEVQVVENGKITDIAIMDTTTAAAMGKRQIGSLGTLATQYELGQFMTTTVNGQAKKVATMGYGGFWKWLNRRGEGIPGYVSVDPVDGSRFTIRIPPILMKISTVICNSAARPSILTMCILKWTMTATLTGLRQLMNSVSG